VYARDSKAHLTAANRQEDEGKYRFAVAHGGVNLNSLQEVIMAASITDGALLLAKKLGSVGLILFGIIGIAVGLEYRSTGISAGVAERIVALALGMALLALKIIRRNAG
jgi:hypothetical protein